MSYKQKLTNLLCEVKEIKDDIMELRFGCKLENTFLKIEDIFICYLGNANCIKTVKSRGPYHFDEYEPFEGTFKIIGNDLEERYLRLYCRKNNIKLIFDGGNLFHFNTPEKRQKRITYIEIFKPFSEQTEQVYEKIFNFLTETN